MNVKNKRCIRNLSFKQLRSGKSRNLIAVFAIALTTLLFTSLFTIALSLNASYEEYTFRQIGGYSHGTFKDLDEAKIKALSGHRKVKEYGLRKVCGILTEAPFAKTPAEISWMDANNTRWSYATPTTGRMPESGMEISMDTEALKKLGIPARLGEQVTLSYTTDSTGLSADGLPRRDTFTLVGFWEYDNLMPVHFINVSAEYVEQLEAEAVSAGGEAFRADMNVMLASSINIRGVMESIDTDLGYQWENRDAENCVRIGTNWGYSTEELTSNLDPTVALAIVSFLLLTVFTGYLIIYNIFQISVTNDIRFYGLLKTIGTTPGQLKRIVRRQALYLSIVGIPLGCILGYGVGAVLTPRVLEATMIHVVRLSVSPLIFAGAALFSLLTVRLSCARPGKKAAQITPVEAVRYTEQHTGKKTSRATRGAKIKQMAFANLSRNRTKTLLVILSLSLAVVLFNCVFLFTRSFDMEKYVSRFSVADFMVGTPPYFYMKSGLTSASDMPKEAVSAIQENTDASLAGSAYAIDGRFPRCWITEEAFYNTSFLSDEILQSIAQTTEKRGDLLATDLLVQGLDAPLFEKLTVYEGSLEPLLDPAQNAIAIVLPDGSDKNSLSFSIKPGDSLTVTYVEEGAQYDRQTGKPADETTPEENIEYRVTKGHDVTYTVCALVGRPHSMSFRYSLASGYEAILSSDALKEDWGGPVQHMYYLFDTPDSASEAQAEAFLADYTGEDASGLMYESKAQLREDFNNFRTMFLLVGTILCIIVGLVGILNFFNAILTGILTRHREFAMLEAVGMTGRQLKQMLVYEGIFYAIGAGLTALCLCFFLNPLAGKLFGGIFCFFSYRFTVLPVLAVIPVFLLSGILLPLVLYRLTAKKSVVERLREI